MSLKSWSDEQIDHAIRANQRKEPLISAFVLIIFAPVLGFILVERAFTRSHWIEVVAWCTGAAACVLAYFIYRNAREKMKFVQELMLERQSRLR